MPGQLFEQGLHSTEIAVFPPRLVEFVWLEITGQCNLRCTHCYANSKPTGTHGTLTFEQWKAVIAQIQRLGVGMVQFIGGEPTLHPHFADLVRLATQTGLQVEVYTNLLRVPLSMWDLFKECKVSLATSFYSSEAQVHDRVTTRTGSQQRTLSNIKIARSRGIPIRVSIIKVSEEQDVTETEQMLHSLGVLEVGMDSVRGIGRGLAHNKPARAVDALCGQCASLKAAVDPLGWVYPCVFSRWLRIGNVHTQDFEEIVSGDTMKKVRTDLEVEFATRYVSDPGMPELSRERFPDPRPCSPTLLPPRPQPPCIPASGPECLPQIMCPPNVAPPCGPRR